MDFVHRWNPIGGGRWVYTETKEVVSVVWWTWKRPALCILVVASLPFLFPVLFLSLFVGFIFFMPLLCGLAAYLVLFRGFSLPWNLTKLAFPKLLAARGTSSSQTRFVVSQAEGREDRATVESQGREIPNELVLCEAGVDGIKPAQEVLDMSPRHEESEHEAEETDRESGLPKVSGVGYPIEPERQLPIAIELLSKNTFSGEDNTEDVVRASAEIDSGELLDNDVESKTVKDSEIGPDGSDLEAEAIAKGEFVEDKVPAKGREDILVAEHSTKERTQTDPSSESVLLSGLSQRHIVDDKTGEDITKARRTSEGISRVPKLESYGRVDGASLELESAPPYQSLTDGFQTGDSGTQEETKRDRFVEAESSKEQSPFRGGLVSASVPVAELPTSSQQAPLDAEQIGEEAEVESLPSSAALLRGPQGRPTEVAQEPSFALGEQPEKELRSEAPASGAHVKDQGEGERDAAPEGLLSFAPGQLGEQPERGLRLEGPASGPYVEDQGEGEADATPEALLSFTPGQLGEQPEKALHPLKDQGGGVADATPETLVNVQHDGEEPQLKPTEEPFLNIITPGKRTDEIEEESVFEPFPSAEHPTEARHGWKDILTQETSSNTGVLGESPQEVDGIGLMPTSPSSADLMNVREQPEESLPEASASGGEAQDVLPPDVSSMSLEPAATEFIQEYHPDTSPSMESGEQRGEDPSPETQQNLPKVSANVVKAGEQPTESSPGASSFHDFTASRGKAKDEMTADVSLKSLGPAERSSIQDGHPDTSLSMESGEKRGEDAAPEGLLSFAPGQLGEQPERGLRLEGPASGPYVEEEALLSFTPGQLGEQPEKGLHPLKDQGGGETDATPETLVNIQHDEEEPQLKPTEELFLNIITPGKQTDEIEEESGFEPFPSAEHPTEARHGWKDILTQETSSNTRVLGESTQEVDGIGLMPKASPSPADLMNVREQPEESLPEASAFHKYVTASGGEAQDVLPPDVSSMSLEPAATKFVQEYHPDTSPSMESGEQRGEDPSPETQQNMPKVSANVVKAGEQPTESSPGASTFHDFTASRRESQDEMTADVSLKSLEPAERSSIQDGHPDTSLSMESGEKRGEDAAPEGLLSFAPWQLGKQPERGLRLEGPASGPYVEEEALLSFTPGQLGEQPEKGLHPLKDQGGGETDATPETLVNIQHDEEEPQLKPTEEPFLNIITPGKRTDEIEEESGFEPFPSAEHPTEARHGWKDILTQETSSNTRVLGESTQEVDGIGLMPKASPSSSNLMNVREQPEESLPEASAFHKYVTASGGEAQDVLPPDVSSMSLEPAATEFIQEYHPDTSPSMESGEQQGEDPSPETQQNMPRVSAKVVKAGEQPTESSPGASTFHDFTASRGESQDEMTADVSLKSLEPAERSSMQDGHPDTSLSMESGEKRGENSSPETQQSMPHHSVQDEKAEVASADKSVRDTTDLEGPAEEASEMSALRTSFGAALSTETRDESVEPLSTEAPIDTALFMERKGDDEVSKQKLLPSGKEAGEPLWYDLHHPRRLSFSRTGDGVEDVEPETRLATGQLKGPRPDEERSVITSTSSEYAWPSESSERGFDVMSTGGNIYQESLPEKSSRIPLELQTHAQADSKSGPSSEFADDWQTRRERWEAESRPGGLLQSAPNMEPHSFEARSMCNPLYEFSTPSPLRRRSSTGVSKDFTFASSSNFSQSLKRHSAPEYRHSRPSLSDSTLSPPHHRFREFKKGRYREWSEHDDLGTSFTPGLPARSYSASWSESLEPYEGEFEGLLQYWRERDKATPSPTSLPKYNSSATSPAVLAAQLREEINTIQRIVGQDIEPQHSLWKDVESLSELVGMQLPYMGDVSDLMKARQGLDLLKVVVGIRWDIEQGE